MRWVTYTSPQGAERAGLLAGDRIRGLDQSLLDILRGEGLAAAARTANDNPVEIVDLDTATLRAPVPVPPSVRDFMAFENHVVTSSAALGREVSQVWYDQPVFYFTNPAAVIGPTEASPIAPGSIQWDYELEIAAIIGRHGRDLHPEQAEEWIAGYTILCDWSARDLQTHEMKIGLGPAKGKDTATSLGPYLVTPDELEPYRTARGYDLAMSASVNGTTYSAGSWSDLYWNFGQLLAYASRGTELRPGDVIGSGTVGTGCILELSQTHGTAAYPWLTAGDQVVLAVDRLGEIRSVVVDGSALVPLA